MRRVRRKLARHKVKFGLPDVSHKKTQLKILKMIIIELLLVVQILVKNAESHNHQLSFIIREMSVKNHNKISRVTSEKWSVQKNVSHVINTRERTILKKMDHQIFVYLFYSITNHSAHCMMGKEGPTLSTVSLICVYVAITRFVQETLFVYW